MHIPNHFQENDTETLHQYLRRHAFGTLILADDQGIEANHAPFLLQVSSDKPLGVLQCHLARNNPAWQRLTNDRPVLAVFQGPHAYVSPSWYPSKQDGGRVVPTWNYLAVHAEGIARVIEDPDWLRAHLQQLTAQHEAQRAEPWTIDDAPKDYTQRLMRGMVGIEITIERLSGKLKASQNQPAANRAGVIAGLQHEDTPQAAAMAQLISPS